MNTSYEYLNEAHNHTQAVSKYSFSGAVFIFLYFPTNYAYELAFDIGTQSFLMWRCTNLMKTLISYPYKGTVPATSVLNQLLDQNIFITSPWFELTDNPLLSPTMVYCHWQPQPPVLFCHIQKPCIH